MKEKMAKLYNKTIQGYVIVLKERRVWEKKKKNKKCQIQYRKCNTLGPEAKQADISASWPENATK